MDLSVVIVNWNSKAFVRNCIASLILPRTPQELEIVVIDGASFDGCGEMLRDEFPHVRFIQCGENVGFAKANNIAFRATSGEFVLFLNPDTEVVGMAVDRLVNRLEGLRDAGALGCKLLNTDGSIQTSCIQSFPTVLNQFLSSDYLQRRWPRSKLWGMEALSRLTDDPQEVEAVSGACIMVRREVFESVGGFSEDYFMYAEDIDLCYKFKEAGLKNYFIADAKIIHHGGSSSNQAPNRFSVVMAREAVWRFLRKTRGQAYGMLYRVSVFTSACVRILLLLIVMGTTSIRKKNSDAKNGFGKWWAILCWSLNCEPSVRRYYPVLPKE